MPVCINCRKPLRCVCKQPDQPIGQTAIGCTQLTRGKLWIHVVDDAGTDVKKVSVVGVEAAETAAGGLAMFDDVPPKTYTCEVKSSPALLEIYDLPPIGDRTKRVPVNDGILAHVLFVVTRKAPLKVKFILKSGAGLSVAAPFDKSPIAVKAAYTGTGSQAAESTAASKTGTADFQLVSAGKYTLTPDYSKLDKSEYHFVEGPRVETIDAGDTEPFVFEIIQKAKISVKFVFRPDPKTSDDLAPFTAQAIEVAATPTPSGAPVKTTTVDGAATLSLAPGRYTIAPNYSTVDSAEYEYLDETRDLDVDGDAMEPLVFELARKAPLIVHVVYKYEDPTVFLQNTEGIVTVKAEFQGNSIQPKVTETLEDTTAGIADFQKVSAGKYKLTPDFSKLDKCAFDFDTTPREIEIWPGPAEPVVITVEPLYQKVQFIAHCLLTIPNQVYKPAPGETLDPSSTTGIAAVATGVNPPDPTGQWKDRYHGHPTDSADIAARVEFAKAVIALAKANSKTEGDPKVLKVFMVPECFFQGAYGAYMYEDIFGDDYGEQKTRSGGTKGGLLAQLNDAVSGKEWKDWLFAFGTVNCDLTSTGSVEMMNYAPVIRGGLGAIPKAGDKVKDTHLRLIQKAKNSAELIDDARLDPDYVLELSSKGGRRPAVNETHQFQGTEFEETIGKLLMELLDNSKNTAGVAKFTERNPKFGLPLSAGGSDQEYIGIPPALWPELKAELQTSVDTLGITRTTRLVRSYTTKGTPAELNDWIFAGYKKEGAWRFEAEVYAPSWQQIVYRFVFDKWERPTVTQGKPMEGSVPKITWKTKLGVPGRQALLNAVKSDLDGPGTLFTKYGIEYLEQKTALRAKVDALLNDDAAAIVFMDDLAEVLPLSYIAGKLVIWKKLVEVYLELKGLTEVAATGGASTLSYREYCFAAARKVGPFLDLDTATALEACKRLLVGLEICADHAAGRLKFALLAKPTTDPACDLDLQLIPSCGMNPVQTGAVARVGGYVFNCDGWIHVTPTLRNNTQGRTLEVRFDKPRPKGDNAFYPHSIVGLGGPALNMAANKPEHETLDNTLAATIFGMGAGELHIYKALPLPK